MRILVADDHAIVRDGLVSSLTEEFPKSRIDEAADALQVLELLNENADYSLVLLDLFMPFTERYELVSTVCDNFPELSVVVVSASEEREDILAAIDRGAAGYIPKTSGRGVMIGALRLVLAGGTYIPENLSEDDAVVGLPAANADEAEQIRALLRQLSRRQRDVLRLLLKGQPNRDIAAELGLSENTVKVHVTAILRALGKKSRAQVIAVLRKAKISI